MYIKTVYFIESLCFPHVVTTISPFNFLTTSILLTYKCSKYYMATDLFLMAVLNYNQCLMVFCSRTFALSKYQITTKMLIQKICCRYIELDNFPFDTQLVLISQNPASATNNTTKRENSSNQFTVYKLHSKEDACCNLA